MPTVRRAAASDVPAITAIARAAYSHRLMTDNLARYRRRGYVETHREAQDGFDRVFLTKALG